MIGFFYTYTNKIASNLSKLLHFVGKKGLEPLSLAALVPKTSAYTNSATCPILYFTKTYIRCRHKYFARRRLQNFATPAQLFFLIEKHTSARDTYYA